MSDLYEPTWRMDMATFAKLREQRFLSERAMSVSKVAIRHTRMAAASSNVAQSVQEKREKSKKTAIFS
jgi:hypothetical protein